MKIGFHVGLTHVECVTIVGHLLVGNHVSFKVCTFHMSQSHMKLEH